MNKLYRSRSDRVLAGICGGLGRYFQIDSTVIRLLFGFLWLASGILPLTLGYLIGIWIIPLEPIQSDEKSFRHFYRSRKNRMLGGICGAIAEAWNLDATVVRLVAVFICFLTGVVPLAIIYCIAWAIIPEKNCL